MFILYWLLFIVSLFSPELIFEILLLTYKILNDQASSYLKDLIVPHYLNRALCSQNAGLSYIYRDMVTRDHRRSRTLGDFKQKRQNNHWWAVSRRAVELRPKNPLIDV